MALKVELKPGERIIVGTAVLRNGDARARFYIEGDAPILREKDILTTDTADSPAKKIYFALQLIYLSGQLEGADEFYFPLVHDFITAAPSSLPIIDEINNLVLGGEVYKALKAARSLMAYEKDLIAHATRGRERVRAGSAGDAVAA